MKCVVLDLETTGSSDHRDKILEVGAVELMDDWSDGHIFQAVVYWDREKSDIEIDPVVEKMHTDNGLWEESANAIMDLQSVDRAFAGWLNRLLPRREGRIPLAGSGVSHFDRRFIARKMPLTHRLLTYWAYDVGVMRRLLRVTGRDDLLQPNITEPKPHRALADATLHAEELQHYVAMLGKVILP